MHASVAADVMYCDVDSLTDYGTTLYGRTSCQTNPAGSLQHLGLGGRLSNTNKYCCIMRIPSYNIP